MCGWQCLVQLAKGLMGRGIGDWSKTSSLWAFGGLPLFQTAAGYLYGMLFGRSYLEPCVGLTSPCKSSNT